MGWFRRAERLVGQTGEDSVVPGYLLLPVAFQRMSSGDAEEAHHAASEAAAIAERFGEHDLFAMASHVAGTTLIKQGRVDEALQFLDEAMVAVTSGEVSPFFAGVRLLRRDRVLRGGVRTSPRAGWTEALTRWCEAQPQLVSFTGRCLAHRAGIKQLHGAWSDALEEAVLARERCEQAMNRLATGQAYQQAELHRLRGDYAAAEGAYRDASRYGREPQPGLALLRVAQGEAEAAAGAPPRARRDGRAPAACGSPSRVRRGRPGAGPGRRRRFGECRARRDRRALRAPDAPRDRGAGSWVRRACPWRAAGCAALAPHCVAGVGGARRAVRGRAFGCSSAWPAGRWETRTELRSSSRLPGRLSTRSAPSPTSGASIPCSVALRGLGPERARARGAPPPRVGPNEPRDRRRARRERAHGRPPRPEHLREARRLVAHRGDSIRLRARPRLVRTNQFVEPQSWRIRAMS